MDTEIIPPELQKTSVLLDTVRQEAAELRNFTITFLTLLLYVSLIVTATDHEQIFKVSPVVLPLLNVNIPILGFYWLMSPFLFFMHLYVLVQHYLFSQLAFRFSDSLRQEPQLLQDDIRRSFGNLPFLHWLLGRHGPLMQTIMTLITVLSLIIWPLFMFWWLQARFLPYHDSDLVFWQQCWLTADVITLAYFWAKIMDEHDNPWYWWQQTHAFYGGIKYLVQRAWNQLKTRWISFRDSQTSFISKSFWRRYLHVFSSRPQPAEQKLKRYPEGTATLKNGLGLMVRGSARILLILFLLTALVFSWMVSLVPDSAQEQRVISDLLWLENLVSGKNNIVNNPASAEPDQPVQHWLLENVNLTKKSWGLTHERLLFIPTARLHEKRLLAFNEENRLKVQEYDLARVLEVECPSQPAKNENQHFGTGLNAKDDSETGTVQEPEKCYQIDSYLPRNLLLRNKVITADKELRPELIVALQAEDIDKQNKKSLNETNDTVLQQITPINLQGRHFEYADFTGSSFPKAILIQTNFNYTDLTLSRFDKALFKNANLQGATLKQAHLENAIIKFTDMEGSDLSGSHLEESTLFDVNLKNARLYGVHMESSTINNLHLEGARLIGAHLEGATLKNANLAGSSLFAVHMEGANLNEAFLAGSVFSNAHLEGATLNNTHLEGAALNNIHMEGSDLTFAHFEGASIKLGYLDGANLFNTYLTGTTVTESPYKSLNPYSTNAMAAKLFNNLKAIPFFQTIKGRGQINTLENRFKSRTQNSAGFSKIITEDDSGQKIPCISDLPAISEKKGPCIPLKKPPPGELDRIYQYWITLACQDNTDVKWLAQAMTKRAIDFANPWPGLAQKFNMALEDINQCPGFAGMPEGFKQLLRNAGSDQKQN